MWQVVLVAQVPDVCDPVLTTLAGASEELTSNTVENVAIQVANHAKECKLPEVEESLTRETPSQEEYHWFRGLGVEFKKTFSRVFDMLDNHV